MPTSSVPAPLPTEQRRRGWLLTCDPGLRAVGVALWKDGVLLHAGAVRGPPPPARGPAVWGLLAADVYADIEVPIAGLAGPCHLVTETMQYQHGTKKGSAEDLLEVQGVAGAIVGVFSRTAVLFDEAPAHAWKGQVPRDVMAGRVEGWLRAQGWWDRVVPSSRATENNDAMHAVGIGKWWLRL